MVHNDWKKFIVEKLKYISLYFSCEIKKTVVKTVRPCA